jgi:hypothetical protein
MISPYNKKYTNTICIIIIIIKLSSSLFTCKLLKNKNKTIYKRGNLYNNKSKKSKAIPETRHEDP